MRSILSGLLIILLSFGLVINEAAAKRFGGGRSFGMQRSQSSLFSSNKTQNTASIAKKANPNRWGGILGGLLVGGLLASLFMGNGLVNGLMTWLLLGVVLFFVINFFRRKMQPAAQSAHNNAFKANPFQNNNQSYTASQSFAGSKSGEQTDDEFLREAKVLFIRLQAAYDQKNIDDINDFTQPEVFAEIKMQLAELGTTPNKTEIINLNAELLDLSPQAGSTVASVRFTGSIKENDEPVSQLDEIWHFRKFNNDKQWLVGGIQQDVHQP